MNGPRSPVGPAGGPSPEPKSRRLSRSFRLSQAAAMAASAECGPPRNQNPVFKTPTRVPKTRSSTGLASESPQDPDIQQDIIWDASSPSPQRYGKRGQRHKAVSVNISEIVSRIAPKHGRPQMTELTLQQWIGDSAAIPCTPDSQAPRSKKKSPRGDGVDALLQLARRFDLNMSHRDVEEMDRRGLELLSQDILEFRSDRRSTDDDLDFLFDRSTQPLSGALSPRPPSEASGVEPVARFEDDWENDDLLDDSLVLEMTQEPFGCSAPKHCSTQKPQTEVKHGSGPGFLAGKTPASSSWRSKNQRVPLVEIEPPHTRRNPAGSDLQKPTFHPRTSAVKGGTSDPTADRNAPEFSPGVSPPAESDFLDDDLDSLFSSEPVWDDPDDDGLFCELCDDLENRIQNAAPAPVQNNVAGVGLGGGKRPAAAATAPPVVKPGGARFTFKIPSAPVSMATGQGLGKCSAAEIELKKRQAMERRRQRRLQDPRPLT